MTHRTMSECSTSELRPAPYIDILHVLLVINQHITKHKLGFSYLLSDSQTY